MISNIIQFSIPRTGSTLLFQVLSDLFPGIPISKAHDWHQEYMNKPVIGSYRDPRATMISYWRTDKDIKSSSIKINVKDINKYSTLINNTIKYFAPFIKNKINHNKMLFLKYEDFYNDFPFLFLQLENFFKISITDSLKNSIQNNRNIVCNKKHSDEMYSFKKFDNITLLHGNHIYNDGSNNDWKKFVLDKDIVMIENMLMPSLKILDYI